MNRKAGLKRGSWQDRSLTNLPRRFLARGRPGVQGAAAHNAMEARSSYVSCRTCDKKRAVAWGSGPGGALDSQGSPDPCHVSCRTCDKKRPIAWGSGPGGALDSQGSAGSVSRFVSHLRQKTRRCVGLRARQSTRFPGFHRVRVAFRVAPATKNAPLRGAPGQAEHSIPRAPGPYRVSCRTCDKKRAIAGGSAGSVSRFVSHLRQKTRHCGGLRRVRVPFRVAPATKNAPLRGAPGQAEHSIPRAQPGPCRVSCRTCDKKRAVAWGSGPGGALDSQGSTGSVSRFVSHLRQKTRRCVGRRARRSTRFPGAPPGPCRVSCRTCDKKRAVAWGSRPGRALDSQGSARYVSRFVSHLRHQNGQRKAPGSPRPPCSRPGE